MDEMRLLVLFALAAHAVVGEESFESSTYEIHGTKDYFYDTTAAPPLSTTIGLINSKNETDSKKFWNEIITISGQLVDATKNWLKKEINRTEKMGAGVEGAAKNTEAGSSKIRRQAPEPETTTITVSATDDLQKESAEEAAHAAAEVEWQKRAEEESAAAELDGVAAGVESTTLTGDVENQPEAKQTDQEQPDIDNDAPEIDSADDSTAPTQSSETDEAIEVGAEPEEDNGTLDIAGGEVVDAIQVELTPIAVYHPPPLVVPVAYLQPAWNVYRIPHYITYHHVHHLSSAIHKESYLE